MIPEKKKMLDAPLSAIAALLSEKKSIKIAVDGRCAAGKTTLAERIAEKFGANIFHMDDFFLPPEKRTKERLFEPGGNVDRERFLREVLLPLEEGKPFSYFPFDCKTQSLKSAVRVEPKPLSVIEGSYSCHPLLFGHYDLRLFLTVSGEEQLRRLEKRCPEKLGDFREKWIPMEEAYFHCFSIEEKCDFVLKR